MFNFFRQLIVSFCGSAHLQNSSANILLDYIDSGASIEVISDIIKKNPSILSSCDDNLDGLCHAISKLNLDLVRYFVSIENHSWDYSTALIVLSGVKYDRSSKTEKRIVEQIYRTIFDKTGPDVFTGLEYINAFQKANKVILRCLILDGIMNYVDTSLVRIRESANINSSSDYIELVAYVTYYKNYYSVHQINMETDTNILQDVKEPECAVDNKEQIIDEIKDNCKIECSNGVCKLVDCVSDLEKNSEDTFDIENKEHEERQLIESQSQNELETSEHTEAKAVEFHTDEDIEVFQSEATQINTVSTEETQVELPENNYEEIATKEVLDKILSHMQSMTTPGEVEENYA